MSNVSDLVKDVASQLQKNKQTLGAAESCTGGLLSAHITALAGVSDVYLGSVVAYAYEAKEAILGVKRETLQKFGAVSRETAVEMAVGARLKLSSDWSVAITGIAGPTGGTPEKPVGTVCFAVSGAGFEEADQQHFKGDRESVRLQSVEHALKLVLQALKNKT